MGRSLPGSCHFQCLGAIACSIGNGNNAFDASPLRVNVIQDQRAWHECPEQNAAQAIILKCE